MSQKEFKYDAFISYRHADLDSFVAVTLHRLLESFKVPKIADREIRKTGKQGIKRVFRDQDELPLAGNLSAPITEALKESDFLIVICSPRTRESLWVQREIETFLEYRDASHILAVLVEGEPSEAFPSQICTLKKEVVALDGTKSYEEVEVEPLAADVRGNSKKEVKAKLKKEMFRIAAPMLGCEYDDLKQRHRERKIKRLLVTFATAGTICLAFGAFSTYQALRIQRQSKQIQAQAEDLQALQSKSLSNLAVDLYESGDRQGGLLVALAGLPENLEEPERPIVAEATAALAKILHVYENETSYAPYLMLSHDTITETSILNEDGTVLVSLDQLGQLYSWDVDSGEMLAKTEDQWEIARKDNLVFLDKDTLLCAGKKGMACLDAKDFSVKWSLEGISASGLALSEDKTIAAVSGAGTVSIYDTSNGKMISSYANESYTNIGNCMRFSPDGNYLAVSLTTYFFNEGQGKGILLNTSNCETLKSYETKFISLDEMFPTNEGECYIVSYDQNTIGGFGMTLNENLSCYNADGTLRFQIEGMMAISSPIREMGDCIVYPNGSSIYIASKADGSVVREIQYNANVCNYEIYEEGTVIIVGLADGSIYGSYIQGADVLTQPYVESCDFRVRHVYHSFNKVIEEPVSSNKILVYKQALGSKARSLVSLPSNIRAMELTSDKSLLLVYAGESIVAYQNEGEKEVYQLVPNGSLKDLLLLEEGNQFFIMEYGQIEAYRLSDGELLGAIEMKGDFWDYKDNKLYVRDKGGMSVYDAFSLESLAFYETGSLFKGFLSEDETTLVGVDYDDRGFYYDTVSKKQTELEWSGRLLVPNEQRTKYLIADAYANQVCIYPFGEMTPEASMEMKTDFIDAAGFSPDGEKIFVSLKDGSVKIYESKDFTLVKTIENVPGVNKWEKALADNMELLYNCESSQTGYLLNENMELLYEIPNFFKVSGDGTIVYSSSGKKVLAFPVYDLQMLVDEAKEVLGGRKLTQEEKKKYLINQ